MTRKGVAYVRPIISIRPVFRDNLFYQFASFSPQL